MPLDRREAALAACHTLLNTLAGSYRVYRTPTSILTAAQFPCVAMFDGSEGVEDTEAGYIKVETAFDVRLGTKSHRPDDLGTRLNAMRAAVLAALGADPTLHATDPGLITSVRIVRYRGADPPDFEQEEGAEPSASMTLNFVIERDERDLDPFA